MEVLLAKWRDARIRATIGAHQVEVSRGTRSRRNNDHGVGRRSRGLPRVPALVAFGSDIGFLRRRYRITPTDAARHCGNRDARDRRP
jgi:hypothetical protein